MCSMSVITNMVPQTLWEDRGNALSVRYCPMVGSKEELAGAIEELSNPGVQVITWFLGRKGLRKDWLLYCRDDLMNVVREVAANCFFYLYDIRNWANLANPSIDRTKIQGSKVTARIRRLAPGDICCLDSASYFQFLKDCNNERLIDYTNSVLWKREVIWEKSENMPLSGVSIEDSLGSSQLLEGIRKRDVLGAYSGLQYLEGCYLIQKVIERCADSDSPRLDIVFLLPNDEYEFYDSGGFENDVRELICRQYGELNKPVTISFIPFLWGNDVKERPYLSDDEPVRGAGLELIDSIISTL